MKEEWKDVVGYEGLYQVSNLGRVKRLKGNMCRKERILSLNICKRGYCKVWLCLNGKSKKVLVHRILMESFAGKSSLHIDHIDGNPQNNKIDNLEYVTARENITRAQSRLGG